MATRFRLPSSGSPPVSPAFQTYSHALAVRRPLPLTDTTPLTTVAQTPDAADHLVAGDVSFFQGVSEPLAAQTIAAQTVTFTMQGLEAHANNNLFGQLWIGVVSGDGNTPLATLLAKTAGTLELTTSLASRSGPATTTAYTITVGQEGARLVVEISLVGTPTATGGVQGHNGSLRFGGNGAGGDLLATDNQTGTTLNPWLEFPNTLTFLVRGTTTRTLDDLSRDLDGAVLGVGAFDKALGALTVDGDGEVVTIVRLGTLTQTLDALTSAGTTSSTIAGTTDQALDPALVDGEGMLSGPVGALAQTLDALTVLGAGYKSPAQATTWDEPGVHWDNLTYNWDLAFTEAGGALVQTLADLTTALQGIVPAQGYLTQTLDALTAEGDAVTIVQGVLAKTLDALTVDFDGVAPLVGATVRTLDDLTRLATGVVEVQGQATRTLAPATSLGVGVALVVGTTTRALDDALSTGVGIIGTGQITGALTRTLGDLTAVGAGIATAGGTLTRTLDVLTAVGAGIAEAGGTLDKTLATVTVVSAASTAAVTRLQLPSAGTPAVTPAYQSYSHALGVRRPLPRTDVTTLTTVALTPDAADHLVAGDTVFFQGVSDQLNPQTLPAQVVTLTIQGLEEHDQNNLFVQLWIGVVSGDGLTPLGTILAKTADTLEVGTALQSRTMAPTTTPYTITPAQTGARLVVEISLVGTPTGTGQIQGHNGSLRFGGSGTDALAPNDSQTTLTLNPWLEFPTAIQWFEIRGQLGSVLADATCVGVIATPPLVGVLTRTLESAQCEADAISTIAGAALPVLADLTVTATGGGVGTGSLARTLDDLTLVSAGSTGPISGAAALTLAPLTRDLRGTVLGLGSLVRTLDDAASVMAGTVAGTGTLSRTLGALVSDLRGTVLVRGSTSQTLDALTLTTATAVQSQGALTRTLESAVGVATGQALVRGILGGALVQVQDDFERADGPLGAPWATWDPGSLNNRGHVIADGMAIPEYTEDVAPPPPSTDYVSYYGVELPPDQWAEITIGAWAGRPYLSVLLRVTLDGDGYLIAIFYEDDGNKGSYIVRTEDTVSSFSPAIGVAQAWAVGDLFRATIADGRIRAYRNDVLFLDWTDPSPIIQAGYAGIEAWRYTAADLAAIESFQAGPLAFRLDEVDLATAGTVRTNTGVLDQTLDALVLEGVPAVQGGFLDRTLADATLLAAARSTLTATSAVTLEALTSTTAGTSRIAGTLTRTLEGSTCAATAQNLAVGTLSRTLGPAVLVATATNLVAGTLSKTLGACTVTATGKLPVVGTLDKTLGTCAVLAQARLLVIGTLSRTLWDCRHVRGPRECRGPRHPHPHARCLHALGRRHEPDRGIARPDPRRGQYDHARGSPRRRRALDDPRRRHRRRARVRALRELRDAGGHARRHRPGRPRPPEPGRHRPVHPAPGHEPRDGARRFRARPGDAPGPADGPRASRPQLHSAGPVIEVRLQGTDVILIPEPSVFGVPS